MNIIILAHTRIGSDFVVGSHHLYKCYRKSGHNVIHLSSPISLFHILHLNKAEVRKRLKIALYQLFYKKPIDSNYIPINILPATRLSEKIPKFLRRILLYPYGLKSALAKEFLGQSIDLLIIDHPAWVGADAIIPAKKTIYRPTDIYTDFSSSMKSPEERLVDVSDIIIATSLPTKRHIENYNKSKEVHLIRNGVDLAAWDIPTTEPTDIEHIPHPRAIYVGALDARFDFSIIEEAANLEPSISFILIGPHDTRQLNSNLSNVYYLGSRLHSELPAYIEHCDVALLTTSDHPANEGRSPMKIYEYAASGLGVVAKRTVELSSRDDTGFVFLYDNLSEFIKSINGVLSNRKNIRENALISAKSMSWDKISEDILEITKNTKGAIN